jgi:DNA-binding GntR family transcriptional regulator
LIEERYGRQIAEIQQDVRAFTVADAAMARKLKVEVGAAALKIVRRYLDAEGRLFEASVSVHPADRFSVSMRLRR